MHHDSMLNRDKYTASTKAFVLVGLFVFSLSIDVLFGTSQYPIVTLGLYGIVLVYEFVSPFIYTPR